MPARILVVDDQPLNVRLMEAKLGGEYYDVMTAPDGRTALDRITQDPPDLVILDIMMPGMDGFEVCRRLKAMPARKYIPVVMVTALNAPEERFRGLEAGADDFLTRPVDDVALFARIRSLLRWKLTQDELLSRQATSRAFGVADDEVDVADTPARILVVSDFAPEADEIEATLAARHDVAVVDGLADHAVDGPAAGCDLVIVSLGAAGFDGLRLCSRLRSRPETRDVPIIAVVDDHDRDRLAKGLDLGINDYVVTPVERNELSVRVRNQLRRHRAHRRLRAEYWNSMCAAATDSLTGLYGRRYLMTHLARLLDGENDDGHELAVVMLDIDLFKAVNDRHGHLAGDRVLKEIADRITASVRVTDLSARYGGEEFVVLMPSTDEATAAFVAERLRDSVARTPVSLHDKGVEIDVTVSVGIASRRPGDDSQSIIERADQALYDAKRIGRNRVVAAMA
ncbi:MAG: PleD family two-component system response regulator [Alphaproteobacteria bacterium]